MTYPTLGERLEDHACLHRVHAALATSLSESPTPGWRSALRAALAAANGAVRSPEARAALDAMAQVVEPWLGPRLAAPSVAELQAHAARLHGADRAALDAGQWQPERLVRMQTCQVALAARQPARIPRIIHFLKTDPDPGHLGPINYLSILSAIRHCQDYTLVLHSPVQPAGALWRQLLPHLELNLTAPPQTLGPHRLALAAHQADVWRVQQLIAHGGFYLDWDLILLRSPDDLRDAVCVMGLEGRVDGYAEVLGVSAIGAQPRALFLQAWLSGMGERFRPDHYVAHSTVLARELALQWPALVRVLPWDSFYRPGWTDRDMDWLFDPSHREDEESVRERFAGSWGVHLFESNASFQRVAAGLSLDELRSRDCNFTTLFRELLS